MLAAACNSRVDEPVVGTYRAVLDLPVGETPVGLDVALEDGAYVLYLKNATERTRVSNVLIADQELHAMFPGYENSLRARMTRKGFEGAVTLIKAGGKEQVIPFHARLGETHRFYEQSQTDNADVAGRWEMALTDEKGEIIRAIALFAQEHDREAVVRHRRQVTLDQHLALRVGGLRIRR